MATTANDICEHLLVEERLQLLYQLLEEMSNHDEATAQKLKDGVNPVVILHDLLALRLRPWNMIMSAFQTLHASA